MVFWRKKRLSKEYVELSIGKVYFKEVTNGMLNDITSMATINRVINDSLFLQLFEYALIDLSKKKVDDLSIKEGLKLRDKLRDILIENEIFVVEKTEVSKVVDDDTANIFSPKDTEWFNKQEATMTNQLGGLLNGS